MGLKDKLKAKIAYEKESYRLAGESLATSVREHPEHFSKHAQAKVAKGGE